MSAALSDGPADPSVGRLRRTIPDAWRIIRPYWFSDDRWPGLGLLLVVVTLTLGMVYLSVLLNRSNNDFFTALHEKNAVAFRRQLIPLGWLVPASILLAVYPLYLNPILHTRCRRSLTRQ